MPVWYAQYKLSVLRKQEWEGYSVYEDDNVEFELIDGLDNQEGESTKQREWSSLRGCEECCWAWRGGEW